MTNMVIAGLGSGALVAGLPTAAAAQAPPTHTGLTTGMTNTTKTIGGAVCGITALVAAVFLAVVREPRAQTPPRVSTPQTKR